jgi:hypothetical protein
LAVNCALRACRVEELPIHEIYSLMEMDGVERLPFAIIFVTLGGNLSKPERPKRVGE